MSKAARVRKVSEETIVETPACRVWVQPSQVPGGPDVFTFRTLRPKTRVITIVDSLGQYTVRVETAPEP